MSDLTLDEYRDMVSRFDWRVVYADLYPDYDASDPDFFARCTEQDYNAGEKCWAFPRGGEWRYENATPPGL